MYISARWVILTVQLAIYQTTMVAPSRKSRKKTKKEETGCDKTVRKSWEILKGVEVDKCPNSLTNENRGGRKKLFLKFYEPC